MFQLLILKEECPELKGIVIATDDGDKAVAAAYSANVINVGCYVIIPEDAAECQISAVEEYGGVVVSSDVDR